MAVSTQHFNQLSEAELERLAVLVEACGAVTNVAAKTLHYGLDSDNHGLTAFTNRTLLENAIGHIFAAVRKMWHAHDISDLAVEAACLEREHNVILHHQSVKEPDDGLHAEGTGRPESASGTPST